MTISERKAILIFGGKHPDGNVKVTFFKLIKSFFTFCFEGIGQHIAYVARDFIVNANHKKKLWIQPIISPLLFALCLKKNNT